MQELQSQNVHLNEHGEVRWILDIGHWTFKLVISNHNKACNTKKTEMFDLFLFFIIMVARMCAHHVKKIRKLYRRFISLEGTFRKMVLKSSRIFKINTIIAEN